MTARGTAGVVCDALDPVLVSAGFRAGQGDAAPDGSGQVIYCIGHDELNRRYPQLPQAGRQDPDGTCDDLVIDVSVAGTVDRLDLEGWSVVETLRHLGRHADAEAVLTVMGRPVVECLPAVDAALRRLFDIAG